jgi:Spy/CpxP family protein refolding chaperone
MRLGKAVFALVLGLLVAAPALAQPPGGPPIGGFGGPAGMLRNNKQLQDELKLTKDQADKLNDALTKVRDDLRDDMTKLRDPNLAQEDREKIIKKMTDGNNKAVDSILKPEQVKRLHQIENQQLGIGIFNKDDVKTTMKLSDKQQEQITDINKDLQKDMREIARGGPGGFGGFDPETIKKRQDLQKKAMDDAKKVLNDKQKETLKDLTGEPFELRFEGFGGGPGGPGRPGGGPGGPGGPGGFGGTGQPGQLLSPFAQDQLKLNADQKKKLEELQKEIDGKLDKILTDDQKKQLKDMARPGRGPGGPGGPGGAPPERP